MNLSQIQRFAALLESKELPSEDDTQYATRYTVRKTEDGSVYLQCLHRADRDPAMHSHPWNWMRTTILHGGYRQECGAVHGGQLLRQPAQSLGVGQGYEMTKSHVHRIVMVHPNTWTLLFVGPKRRDDWGFWIEGRGMVSWQERFKERGVKT